MSLSLRVFDDKLYEYIDAAQNFEKLADGFVIGEGPVWDYDGNRLIFNDIPTNRTMTWSEGDGAKLLFYNGKKSNGNWLDRGRGLIMCDHHDSKLVRRGLDGSGYSVLADSFDDIELNSPNDVVMRSDGLIYFTDPIFGRNDEPAGIPRPYPSERRPVYVLDERKGRLSIAAEGFRNPNGLCFSLDERMMYINDSPAYSIFAYDVSEDGNLSNKRFFAGTEGERATMPDGMKIDEIGNVVCAARDGLYYFDPSGKLLGVLLTEEPVLNFAWGSDDGRTIFITCRSCLISVRTKIRGHSHIRHLQLREVNNKH